MRRRDVALAVTLGFVLGGLFVLAWAQKPLERWSCEREAADRIGELSDAATRVVGQFAREVRGFSGCREEEGHLLLVAVPELGRPEVRRLFRRDGWSVVDGSIASPGGDMAVHYPRHHEVGRRPVVQLTVYFTSDRD